MALAGRLKHPHIVEIYDASIDEDNIYWAMEYLAGGTLQDFGRHDWRFEFNRLIETFAR